MDIRFARLGWARLGLVVVHDLVGTRPQFGHDARIGCTRAKLYGHDRAMWLGFRNVHMQLKVNACNQIWTHATESEHAQEHWGEMDQEGYICSLSSSLVFFTQFYSFLLED